MDSDIIFTNGVSLAEMLNDCSIDGIISIDTAWHITAWNKTAASITGQPKNKVFGKHLLTAIPGIKDDIETMAAIRNAFEGCTSFVPASALFTHRHHLDNYYIPLQDPQLGIKGVMNIIHDVAHRLKAAMQLETLHTEIEKRYRQLQLTSSELANFTLISSNDIKNPIRAIYVTIEQLLQTESGQLSNNSKAAFRRIQSALNKMNLLLDDLQHLTQISMPEKPGTLVSLDEVLADALQELQPVITEKGVQIVAHKLCTVAGYPEQLRLLFHHLLDNAIKFNANGHPFVSISCAAKVVPVNAEGLYKKEYNQVTVTDNGIGMEKEDTGRIFNMFEKLHQHHEYKGSGMGLTIVRKIMYAHGGFIDVESTPGLGSSFHCYFPVTD